MRNIDEPIKLTVSEDAMYQKLIAYGLNNGLTEEQAEKETIEQMINEFPRLKELTKDGFTISLEVINDENINTMENMTKYARKCSVTGEGMNEGWVFDDGDYFKNEQHALEKVIKRGYESLQDAYDDEVIYYTEWNEDEDCEYIEINGVLVDYNEQDKQKEPVVINTWDFVIENYPNYESSDTIAHSEDLLKIVDGEIEGEAERVFKDYFNNDLDKAVARYNEITLQIYIDAVENYLRKQNIK